jgi:hypothetical protein
MPLAQLPAKNRKAIDMESFDKRMALEVMEDALTNIDNPQGRGMATGLCGAFYMCGLLSAEEWEALLRRIPVEADRVKCCEISGVQDWGARARGRFLN